MNVPQGAGERQELALAALLPGERQEDRMGHGVKAGGGCVATSTARMFWGGCGSSVPLKDAAAVVDASSGPLSQIERCSALPG